MNDGESNLHPWIEPELEARIIALVLGEASDFEAEELERLIEERPELGIFRTRMETMHGLLHEVADGEAEDAAADWKLPEEKRNAVLEAIGGEPALTETETKPEEGADPAIESKVVEISGESVTRAADGKVRSFPWRQLLNVAAILCLLGILGSLVVPASSRLRSKRALFAMSTEESDVGAGWNALRREEEFITGGNGDKSVRYIEQVQDKPVSPQEMWGGKIDDIALVMVTDGAERAEVVERTLGDANAPGSDAATSLTRLSEMIAVIPESQKPQEIGRLEGAFGNINTLNGIVEPVEIEDYEVAYRMTDSRGRKGSDLAGLEMPNVEVESHDHYVRGTDAAKARSSKAGDVIVTASMDGERESDRRNYFFDGTMKGDKELEELGEAEGEESVQQQPQEQSQQLGWSAGYAGGGKDESGQSAGAGLGAGSGAVPSAIDFGTYQNSREAKPGTPPAKADAPGMAGSGDGAVILGAPGGMVNNTGSLTVNENSRGAEIIGVDQVRGFAVVGGDSEKRSKSRSLGTLNEGRKMALDGGETGASKSGDAGITVTGLAAAEAKSKSKPKPKPTAKPLAAKVPKFTSPQPEKIESLAKMPAIVKTSPATAATPDAAPASPTEESEPTTGTTGFVEVAGKKVNDLTRHARLDLLTEMPPAQPMEAERDFNGESAAAPGDRAAIPLYAGVETTTESLERRDNSLSSGLAYTGAATGGVIVDRKSRGEGVPALGEPPVQGRLFRQSEESARSAGETRGQAAGELDKLADLISAPKQNLQLYGDFDKAMDDDVADPFAGKADEGNSNSLFRSGGVESKALANSTNADADGDGLERGFMKPGEGGGGQASAERRASSWAYQGPDNVSGGRRMIEVKEEEFGFDFKSTDKNLAFEKNAKTDPSAEAELRFGLSPGGGSGSGSGGLGGGGGAAPSGEPAQANRPAVTANFENVERQKEFHKGHGQVTPIRIERQQPGQGQAMGQAQPGHPATTHFATVTRAPEIPMPDEPMAMNGPVSGEKKGDRFRTAVTSDQKGRKTLARDEIASVSEDNKPGSKRGSAKMAMPEDAIDLNIAPEVVEFEGFINYGSPIKNPGGSKDAGGSDASFEDLSEMDPAKLSIDASGMVDGGIVTAGGGTVNIGGAFAGGGERDEKMLSEGQAEGVPEEASRFVTRRAEGGNSGNIEGAAKELKSQGNVYALGVNNGGSIRATGANRAGGEVIVDAPPADGEMPRESLSAIKESLVAMDEVQGMTWDVDHESGGAAAAPAQAKKSDEYFYEDFFPSESKGDVSGPELTHRVRMRRYDSDGAVSEEDAAENGKAVTWADGATNFRGALGLGNLSPEHGADGQAKDRLAQSSGDTREWKEGFSGRSDSPNKRDRLYDSFDENLLGLGTFVGNQDKLGAVDGTVSLGAGGEILMSGNGNSTITYREGAIDADSIDALIAGEAGELANEVESLREEYYQKSRNHTRSEFLRGVAEGWELPAPASITARMNTKAVGVTREFIYPTEYDPPELPNTIALKKRVAPPAGLDEKNAAEESFSTFSLHVSDVSFKLAQAALAKGEWPEAGKVRIEEFVNALDYGDPNPSQDDKVACNVEQAIHPFLQQRNLMRVSMRTAAAGRAGDTPLRLTFLLDNSGSMERADREETVRRAFALLADQLQPIDQVTLISFARQPRLLADKVSGDQSRALVEVVSNLPSEGGTNLEAALQLAFEKAQEQKTDNAQNRIVLLTDGAANLGNAKPESLAAMIESMREEGIAFDAAGIGADGLNDEILEALTRKGDGRYYLLDRPEDADDGFAKQIAGALRPAAKNVKVQVEFNPERVGNYKLLGFEKHRLKKEDFRDDSVDAAEMAAEEAGVAVYQFEAMPDGKGDVGFVSVRFRDMSSGDMVEKRWPIPYEPSAPRPDQAAPSMQIATAAALLAAKLNGEPLGETVELDELARMVSGLPVPFQNKERVQQLRQMIEKARELAAK